VEREISILSALSHPHIITLLGSERTETMLFILMEFASQGSLAGLCR
jgi:serine/threonine protein kinase